MQNIFYKVSPRAFFLLSKAFKKERLTFQEIQGIIFKLKENLRTQPIPITAEQLNNLESMGVIEKTDAFMK